VRIGQNRHDQGRGIDVHWIPFTLGIKDHTMQYTREYILEKDEWYYMKSRRGRIILIFGEGKLARIVN